MREKTLVLGSGISALVKLFYDPDAYALAGDEVGGLFKQSDDLGPQLIWVTASTTRLMRDLGLSLESRRVSVGYYFKGKLWSSEALESAKLTGEARSLYSLKTRGTGVKTSHMSSGKGSFEVFHFPVNALVDTLLERVAMRLIKGKALAVDPHNHLVKVRTPGLESDYTYDTLVSTVPAPVLLALVGHFDKTEKLLGWDKVYSKLEDASVLDLERAALHAGFDYVYLPEAFTDSGDDFQFHRTRVIGGVGSSVKVVREYTVTPSLLQITRGAIPSGKLQKRGQIVGGHEILGQLPSNVERLGRYAEWRHDRRLEDVLEEVQ